MVSGAHDIIGKQRNGPTLNTQENPAGDSAGGSRAQIARFGAFQFNLKRMTLHRNG